MMNFMFRKEALMESKHLAMLKDIRRMVDEAEWNNFWTLPLPQPGRSHVPQLLLG